MTYLNHARAGIARPAIDLGTTLANLAGRLARAASGALRGPLADDANYLDDRMLDDIGLTRGQVLRPDFHGLPRR